MNTISPNDKRVDVRAKFALPKMLQQPNTKSDAERLIQGINTGELAAIYGNDIGAAVSIARTHNLGRLALIASGEDACLVLDAKDPLTKPPTVFFRGDNPDISKQPQRFYTALQKASQTFRFWQAKQIGRCTGGYSEQIKNLIPEGYCKIVGSDADWQPLVSATAPEKEDNYVWCNKTTDNVKGQAYFKVDNSQPYSLIAQFFFETGSCHLNNADFSILNNICDAYRRCLQVHSDFDMFVFSIYGYADHRNFAPGNQKLSEARAERIREYLDDRLGEYSRRYSSGSVGCGVHSRSQMSSGGNAKLLSQFRRVDVFAPPPVRTLRPPRPPIPQPALPDCTRWRAKIERAVSASLIAGIDFVWLTFESRDPSRRNHRMNYSYRGLGVGSGFPVAINDSSSWFQFTTSRPVKITEFQGWATHVQDLVAVFGRGVSIDYINLTGPKMWKGADLIELRWEDLGHMGGDSTGISLGMSAGALFPDGEPRSVS